MTDEMDEPPREGSVAGYDRDVLHLDPEAWVVDETEEPEAAAGSAEDDFHFRSGLVRIEDGLRSLELGAPVAPAVEAAADQAMRDSAESRHLTVDAPTQVRPRQAFAVHVQLTLAARGSASSPTRIFVIPEAGRVVTIDLRASDNLAPQSDTTLRTRVGRGADSDPVRFELQATAEGKATLDIDAFADQQYIASVHVDMMVQQDAQGGQQHVEVPSTVTAADPRALTLEIQLDPARTYYEFRLRGDTFTDVPERAPFGDLDLAARGLQQQLNELARGTRYSDAAVQAILRNQGADLFTRLPSKVQRTLLASVGAVERLSIVLTENDPVPWELVYAQDASKRGFLGDLFLVTRWRFGMGPPIDVGRGERCYVLPPQAPTAAANEIATVQQHLGAGRRISTVDEVLGALEQHRFGLMHFAAHNVPNFQRPSASSIPLDLPFLQSMVGRALENALVDGRPLVFLNACSSNTPTPTLADTGAEGWAAKFLLMGAGGFIGTLWEIRDGSAARFADEFYRHVANREPLGASFRQARTAIRSDGDPTWLAYTLYAHPAALYQGVGS